MGEATSRDERPGAPGSAIDPAAGRQLAAFRLVLGLATLAMLGRSWALWVGVGDFPRVPFVGAWPSPPRGVSWAVYATLLATVASAAFGLAPRASLLASVGLMGGLVLGDQNRLQPWAYQYLLTALALATASEAWALGLARLFVIALYLHSGLSKLDASFARELGPTFLRAGLAPLGLDPSGWPPPWRTGLALAMPTGELLVALALAFPATRRLGLAGAVALHVALIGVLGPWGLDHSEIVLIWNAALIAEGLVLFGGRRAGPAFTWREARATRPAVAWLFVLAAAMPFAERRGWWDTWPSFALYASHDERADVVVHRDDREFLPPSIRRHFRPAPGGPWLVLDPTAWSRAERGVPAYPQGRVGFAVGEALASRYRMPHLLRVVHRGRAERFSGRREIDVYVGLDEIRRRAGRFLLNAHPESPGLGDRFGMDRAWGRPGPGR